MDRGVSDLLESPWCMGGCGPLCMGGCGPWCMGGCGPWCMGGCGPWCMGGCGCAACSLQFHKQNHSYHLCHNYKYLPKKVL